MKYKIIKRIGLCITTMALLMGTVAYPKIMVNATSSQMSEIDRVLTEETSEMIKENVQQQGTKKSAAQTRWNKQPGQTSVTRQTYIGSGTTKIEIFYSSSVESPQLLLQSPSKKIYHPGTTTKYEDTVIVYRKGYVVTDYPDIKYDILYISESQEPGMWDIAFTVEDDIDEFMVITARVADDWENFHTDYKTAPTDIIIWEMTPTSHYTANDITSIVAKDETIPTNHIAETVVIEQESASPIILIVIGMITLILAGTVTAIIAVNRAGKAKNREKSLAIENVNKRLRLKRKKENESLDKILEEYESQYSDDEYFSSFNNNEPEDEENSPMPEPVNKVDNNPLPKVNHPMQGNKRQTELNKPIQTSAKANNTLSAARESNTDKGLTRNEQTNNAYTAPHKQGEREYTNEQTNNSTTQVKEVNKQKSQNISNTAKKEEISRSRKKISSAEPTMTESNPVPAGKRIESAQATANTQTAAMQNAMQNPKQNAVKQTGKQKTPQNMPMQSNVTRNNAPQKNTSQNNMSQNGAPTKKPSWMLAAEKTKNDQNKSVIF